MKRIFFLAMFLAAFWLAGCGAPPIPTPTQASEPQSLSTISPYALEFMVYAVGDLPQGYTASEITNTLPEALAELDAPAEVRTYTIQQSDELGGGEAGFVTAMRFTETTQMEAVWEQLNRTLFTFESLDDLGVPAGASEREVVFSTCDTIVFIQFDNVYVEEVTLLLAKRILIRMQAAPCQL